MNAQTQVIKPQVKFKPHERADGKFAIEIFRDDVSVGFIHWIESSNGQICTVNRADMVMAPIWSKEECQANCNWLDRAYVDGKVK